MARFKFLTLTLLAVTACAPSPLYVGRPRVGTGGEIPRDGRGEPIWSAIRAAPEPPYSPDLPVNPGVPITPPA